MENRMTILVVEDDLSIARALTISLTKQGYRCVTVQDGREAVERFSDLQPHLVILDMMLPGLDGREVLRQLRSQGRVPVIILTALSEEYDLIEGFQLGADDYITKPFSLKELHARVGAVLGRSYPAPDTQDDSLRYRRLALSPGTRRVTISGREVELTKKEFNLLQLLMQNKSLVFSRESLIEAVWADSDLNDIRTVDTHIKQLRSKLGRYGGCIETVWGVGYRFVGEET